MTKQTINRSFNEDYIGKRLDQGLALLFPEYSREKLKNWLKSGFISIDGTTKLKPTYKIIGSESISLEEYLENQNEWLPQPVDFEVVYSDDDVIIVNKPVGLVVHPAAGNFENTLVNGILHKFPEQNVLPRAGIIHRLDKNTSGLLIICKNLEALNLLSKDLQNKIIRRKYLAVVNGVPISGKTIETHLGRHPNDRKKRAVVMDGKRAVTHFKVKQKFKHHALLDVELETGRTHQIRVHMAHIKHHIVGDRIYGYRPLLPKQCSLELKEVLQGFPRQALHACEIEFTHPRTKEKMFFSASLPDDLHNLLRLLTLEEKS